MQRVDIPDEARRDEKTASIQTGIQVQARPGGVGRCRSPAEACRDHGLSPATRPGQSSDPRAVKVSDVPAPSMRGWCHSLILGLGLLFAYTANGREMGTDDTEATTMLPLSLIARGRNLARSVLSALA